LTDDSLGLRFQPDTSGLGDAITGQRVAYQRVSSLDQRVDRQLYDITVQRTFTDTVSGKDTDRPQLEAMLGFVRGGDTVIVMHSMDRLARNLEDLRRIVRELTDKGVRVQFLTEPLTFTGDDTAMATLLLSVMGAFAEFSNVP
jgi:DNA invertase Pin-like site-specific DNA recombinase